MDFGDCHDCGSYSYLEAEGKCPNCVSSHSEWVVILNQENSRSSIVETGLTEEEAKEIASEGKQLEAVKHS